MVSIAPQIQHSRIQYSNEDELIIQRMEEITYYCARIIDLNNSTVSLGVS